MNDFKRFMAELKAAPELDRGFRPVALENLGYLKAVRESGKAEQVAIAIERENGLVSVYRTEVFGYSCGMDAANRFYIEKLVKTLLWLKGGWRIVIGGPPSVGEYVGRIFRKSDKRGFDAEFMSKLYEKPFTVELCEYGREPAANERPVHAGGNLNGCRIGLDLGGSDRKVSALIDGEVIFSEEKIWHPKRNSDPEYHYAGIMDSIRRAAKALPRIDSIGISSAGIYINNTVGASSLFIKVPRDIFEEKVKDIFLRVQKEMNGIPVEVLNDGDITAIAGAMSLDDTNILGLAMGTSLAVGYVDADGNITGWLNEFAFIPVDNNPGAMADEWSGDIGCGVKYFSQDAVIKLAPAAGIPLDEGLNPAEKLVVIQKLMEKGDERAYRIYESIGSYLGYAIINYALYYDTKHLIILGRVTSGKGGEIMAGRAGKVLWLEAPGIYEKIRITLPDEKLRRIGQSVAAASLPKQASNHFIHRSRQSTGGPGNR